VFNYQSGRVYKGNWRDGKRTGRGELILPSGDRFIGDFVDNYITGLNSECYFSDGSVYKGAMVNSKKEGKGEFIWSTGERYVGDFKNCLREGYGVYYFTDGTVFKGYWKNDLEHGHGVIEKNGEIEEGEWEKGVKKTSKP